MTAASTIPVSLATDDDLQARITAAAGRLGAELEIAEPSTGETTIGEVAIPSDAPEWLLEAALLRALHPSHVLFLCVANSARSQMAEGLARSLAPADLKVSSAGSVPTSVRPEAVAVLSELGIDVAHHRSTGVDDVEGPVDAVITLCAEEVCPVWLGDAWRLHWGLPDPAAVEGDSEERLAAFRAVRDELAARLSVLFGGGNPPGTTHVPGA